MNMKSPLAPVATAVVITLGAVSATVARPEQFAARYLRDAVCVVARTRRQIRAKGFEGRGPEAMAAHLDHLAVLQILRKEVRAAQFDRRAKQQAVPPRV